MELGLTSVDDCEPYSDLSKSAVAYVLAGDAGHELPESHHDVGCIIQHDLSGASQSLSPLVGVRSVVANHGSKFHGFMPCPVVPPLACSAPGPSVFPSSVLSSPLAHAALGWFSSVGLSGSFLPWRSAPGFFCGGACCACPVFAYAVWARPVFPVFPRLWLHEDEGEGGHVLSDCLHASDCVRSGLSVAQSDSSLSHPSSQHVERLTQSGPCRAGARLVCPSVFAAARPSRNACSSGAGVGGLFVGEVRSGLAVRDCRSCPVFGSEKFDGIHLPPGRHPCTPSSFVSSWLFGSAVACTVCRLLP